MQLNSTCNNLNERHVTHANLYFLLNRAIQQLVHDHKILKVSQHFDLLDRRT